MSKWIAIIFLNTLKLGPLEGDEWYCPYILETRNNVSKCPSTYAEIVLASTRLNCEKHSLIQNCTKPTEFVYHCVIDAEEKHLFEVCARNRYIFGFCAELNIEGARIQAHYSRKCTNMDPPCPRRYHSSEAYKYKVCHDLINDSQKQKEENYVTLLPITTDKQRGDSTFRTHNEPESTSLTLVWVVPVISGIISLAIFTILIIRRRNVQHVPNPFSKEDETTPALYEENSGTAINEGNLPEEQTHCHAEDCKPKKILDSFEKAASYYRVYWLPIRVSILKDLNMFRNDCIDIVLNESAESTEFKFIEKGMRRAVSLPFLAVRITLEPRKINVKECKSTLLDMKSICEKALPNMKENVRQSTILAELLQEFSECNFQSFSNEKQNEDLIRGDTILMDKVSIIKLGTEVKTMLSTTLENLTLTVDVAFKEMETTIDFLQETIVQETLEEEDVNKHSEAISEVIRRLDAELLECQRIFGDTKCDGKEIRHRMSSGSGIMKLS